MSSRIPPRRYGEGFPTHPEFPGPPRKSKGLAIAAALLIGGLMVVVVGTGIWFTFFGPGSGAFGSSSVDPADAQWAAAKSPELHCAQLAAGFGADRVGVDRGTQREFERLLDALVKVTSSSDDSKFQLLVDFDRLAGQVQMYSFANLSWFESNQLRQSLEVEIVSPLVCERYSIAHIDLSPSAGEATVDVYLWDEYDDLYEYRLWTIRQGRRWKIYDWEDIEKGRRESRDWAQIYTYCLTPGWEEYEAAMEDITAATLAESTHDSAQALRRAESRAVLPQIADVASIEIAFAWLQQGDFPAAIAAAELVQSPAVVPGTYYVRALAYQQMGEYAKSIDMIDRFEKLVGAQLTGCQMRALALTADGKFDAAASQWNAYLQLHPDDLEALESLARTLDVDQSEELLAHVERCRDPADTAHALADATIYSNLAVARAMLAFLEKREPDSSRLIALQAEMAERDERVDEAIALYRQAIASEQDADLRDQLMRSLANVLLGNGQVLDAYQVWPDANRGFHHVMDSWYDDDLDVKFLDVQAVIDAYRRTGPDDPWLEFYTGALLLRHRKYDEAAQRFTTAIAQADEYDREYFRDSQLLAFHKAGRSLDAYQTIPPADETFVDLADRCIWDRQPDMLAKLIAAHRLKSPDDDWLDYYQGSLYLLEKDYEQAKRRLRRGAATTADEDVEDSYRSKLVEVYIAADEILAAYNDLGPSGEIFARLAANCYYGDDWDQLDLLVRRHRQYVLDDFEAPERSADQQATLRGKLLKWESELHWARKDYNALVKLLGNWPQQPLDTLESWEQSELKLKLTHSYLHTRKPHQARRLAAEIRDEDVNLLPLILVEASAGDIAATAELAQQHVRNEYGSDDLYDDEELRALLYRPKFRPVRLAAPPPLYMGAGSEQVVLLFPQPVTFGAPQIASLLKAAGMTAGVEELPGLADAGGARVFAIAANGQTMMVTLGSEPYVSPQRQQQLEIESDELREALGRHQAWASVATLTEMNEESNAPAYRVAAALLDEASMVLFFDRDRLRIAGEEAKLLLLAEEDAKDMEAYGESVYLYRETELDQEAGKIANTARRRLPQLAKAFKQRRPEQVFDVLVAVHAGQAKERIWLPVERVSRRVTSYSSSHQLVGIFPQDSRLNPYFKQGEPVAIDPFQVLDWKYTDGDATIHAADLEEAP